LPKLGVHPAQLLGQGIVLDDLALQARDFRGGGVEFLVQRGNPGFQLPGDGAFLFQRLGCPGQVRVVRRSRRLRQGRGNPAKCCGQAFLQLLDLAHRCPLFHCNLHGFARSRKPDACA
jgi:hypothetical protein